MTTRAARFLLIAVALVHVVIPAIMWWQRGQLHDQIARSNPDLPPAGVDGAVQIALIAAAVFHAVFAILNVWLTRRLGAGRGRIATTVVQLLAAVFSIVSWRSSPMFHAVIPVVTALELLTVVLVWLPSRDTRRSATP
ncbi:hypothetical protein UK23_43765 [Lentzea aerocolonigenes]|uniref:Integral membrane protein n=1 Tax=Lentzea aerocolonigenes TaxID=68170 RepID=A0A0F0GIF0_LENAE|nr:hypothetical protein [Lentzea aerocolonigenes]KJK34303.1 hypothetical protein UK23_43765 [Lentzea aerocolonigenes]